MQNWMASNGKSRNNNDPYPYNLKNWRSSKKYKKIYVSATANCKHDSNKQPFIWRMKQEENFSLKKNIFDIYNDWSKN